jgi:hypothetical protein
MAVASVWRMTGKKAGFGAKTPKSDPKSPKN